MQYGSSGKEEQDITSEIEREVETDGVDQEREGVDHVPRQEERNQDGGEVSQTHSHSTSTSDSDHIDQIRS